MRVWIVTATVWVLFTMSVVWLLHHLGDGPGSGTRPRRGSTGPLEGNNEAEETQWRRRFWWSKTK